MYWVGLVLIFIGGWLVAAPPFRLEVLLGGLLMVIGGQICGYNTDS